MNKQTNLPGPSPLPPSQSPVLLSRTWTHTVAALTPPARPVFMKPPARLSLPQPRQMIFLSAVTIMSHRVVITVIADGPDNLPAVICTIEEYFHFSLFLVRSSRLDCGSSHQQPLLVCSRRERDLSSSRNISSASRGETQLHHPTLLTPL